MSPQPDKTTYITPSKGHEKTRSGRQILVAMTLLVAVGLTGVVWLVWMSGPAAAAGTATAAMQPTDIAATQDNGTCGTSVVHDRFRFDDGAISTLANGTTVTSVADNTRVAISEDNRFYSLEAENPNAYCVEFTVQIASEAIPTADLPGSVTSNSGDYQAEWRSVADFARNTTYTEIVFTLPGNTTATFAPSADRVASLAWVTDRKEEAQGIISDLAGLFSGDSALEDRHYTFRANASEKVDVPLTQQINGTTLEVTAWHAEYKTPDGVWMPLNQDANAPVFYREVDNGTVQLVYNEQAKVKFVANPTLVDKASHEYVSYTAGIRSAESLVSLSMRSLSVFSMALTGLVGLTLVGGRGGGSR